MKKSLISAIKKLLTKLGAEEIEGNNLVEVIDSGADMIEGDNGPLVLEFATTDPYTVATPLADIKTAIDAGRQVFFKGLFGAGPGYTVYVHLLYHIAENGGPLTFLYFGGSDVEQSVIYEDGTGWTIAEK